MTTDAINLTHRKGVIIATGRLDLRSVAIAIAGAFAFFLLGLMCLSLSRFDAALASVWLPNASAVALLLVARLRNEVPIYIAMAIASLSANTLGGNTIEQAMIFSVANLVNVALVTWLTRRATGPFPDMGNLDHLVRFLIYGGLIGPVCSALLAVLAMPPAPSALLAGFCTWFLADSMGMILIVPAALMLADAVRNHETLTQGEVLERCLLTFGGMTAVLFVFQQDTYPLLFLVPPITLLLAFRIGGLGTALYVPGVALVASWMTYSGIGPIVNNATSEVSTVFIIQAFIAANFLTGLPIAAILGGRERMTDELARGRRELSLLAENVTDAVVRIDNHGTCTYASPSVSAVLGKQPGHLIGQPLNTITLGDANDQIEALVGRLQSGASDKERMTYRRLNDAQDGTPVFIEADCAIANDPVTGERSGVVISARDVTERVELELLLTRARRKAENAAHAKSEFLANMSHEIRTPMNGVLGFAELMLQGDQSDEDRRHTEMIVQSGRSMMLLLNDILDLSKIEAGQISIEHSAVDIYATIQECTVLHRAAAEKKGLKLTFHAPASHPSSAEPDDRIQRDGDEPQLWIRTDPLRLRQIVLNLIGNAVKFTEAGQVDITCDVVGDECMIAVRDTGIGISRSQIQTIFAPFTQAESNTARRFGGTGLGLSISRQLAGLLDGSIEVESEPSEGSTFRLILPAVIAQPEPADEPARHAARPLEMPQAASVLLVEDHDVNRMLGVEMLERCGQSVAVAHDGNEAIAMVMDSVMRGTPFDLVLMDIQMPGCDGYAATRVIRREGIGSDMMPIIALTANAFPEDVDAARKAGMQAHLAKPFVFADLAHALQRWLPTRIMESESPERQGAILNPDRRAGQETTAPVPTSAPTPQAPKHTPALLRRWEQRRTDAMSALREALSKGLFTQTASRDADNEALARMVHKLAGTAGIFGEPELGDQAAALERALRHNLPCEVCEALARELLSYDEPGAAKAQRLAG